MLPELFRIGNYPVHSWGLLLMLGFLLATWRAAKNAPRYNFTPENVWDIALFGLMGGILGARLAYVGLNIPYFSTHPSEILALWTGGMTFYGGLFGGLAAGAAACRWRGVNVADMGDLAAVSFPLGYCLGRIGCFLQGCCYGAVCDLPWAVRFHLPNGELTPPSHPAQLYSAIIAVAMYFLLVRVEAGRRFRGQVLLAYIGLYCIYRFIIEFVREGATAQLSGIAHLTQGQLASLIIAIVVAGIYAYAVRRTVPTAQPAG